MTPGIDNILDDILQREGPGNSANGYQDPGDPGGRTAWGISERSFPQEWVNGPPTRERAHALYYQVFVLPFTWVQDVGGDERLLDTVVDFAVNSGVKTAIKALQRVLGCTDDGAVGQVTTGALKAQIVTNGGRQRHINNELLMERFMVDENAIDARPILRRDEHGWMERIQSLYWPY